MGSRACGLSCMWDLSSWTGDQTHIPVLARWILNHWATEEIILGFQKSCYDQTGSPLNPSPMLPECEHLTLSGYVCTTKKPTPHTAIHQPPDLIQTSPVLPSRLLSRHDPVQTTLGLSVITAPQFPLAGAAPQSFTALGRVDQNSCRWPPIWVCQMFSS